MSLLLIAATLAVYAQVWKFGLVLFDDTGYVNPQVQKGLTAGGFRWAFVGFHAANWTPLTWLSLMLDTTIYGKWPGGYHITNALLHIANVLLVFAVFAAATRNTIRSAFVAAIFAIHPLHVESVAWVSERKDVLSMFFALLALYVYVQWARRQRIWSLAAAFVFFLCSLLSKQTFVTLPFVFLLLDFWPLRRWSGARPDSSVELEPLAPGQTGAERSAPVGIVRLIGEKSPFFLASAAFCVVVVFAQAADRAVDRKLPFADRLLNLVFVYYEYIRKALLPIDLAAFYPHPRGRLSLVLVAWAFVCLASVTVFAIANRRRRPYLLTGWLWYLGAMVPMIGLVQVGGQQMADRYAYFPMLGLYLAVVWLVPPLVPSRFADKPIWPILAVGVLALYAATAFVQVGYWRDSDSLFRHALDVTDDNYVAHYQLGAALLKRGQVAEALKECQEAVRLAPGSARAQYDLGVAYQTANRPNEAAEHYRAALAIDEKEPLSHLNLGSVLMSRRESDAAKKEFLRARNWSTSTVARRQILPFCICRPATTRRRSPMPSGHCRSIPACYSAIG